MYFETSALVNDILFEMRIMDLPTDMKSYWKLLVKQ